MGRGCSVSTLAATLPYPTAYYMPTPLREPAHIARAVIEWDVRDDVPDIGIWRDLRDSLRIAQQAQTATLWAEFDAPIRAVPRHSEGGGR